MRRLIFLPVISLFLGILFPSLSCAQTKPTTASVPAKELPYGVCPTCPIYLDTNVISFDATYIINGVYITRHCKGWYFPSPQGLKRGGFIILENITTKNKDGKYVNLPVRRYVVT